MSLLRLIKEQEIFYKSIVSIECPILSEIVYFTSDGFYHLLNESNRQLRTVGEQYMKLKCLEFAPLVVGKSVLLSSRKNRKKVKRVWKKVEQFALVYEVERGVKIRVILERIGNGKLRFLSVMPHNNKSKKILTTKKRQ